MYKALLPCLVVTVMARSSPNSRTVEEFYQSHGWQGRRYPKDVLEDAKLDVPGLIKKYRYPLEIHKVTTADGYILEMHRIPYGRDSNTNPAKKRSAVLIMHGLLSSSADYVVLGPGSALGYQLAEAGFDVWLGNARGNYYSRNHTNLQPDIGDKFWKFSWDDIGIYDLPAYVDHILKTTGQPKIHYIGHSQGGTAFLVLNSMRPGYNKKFISFHGLAPGAYFSNTQNRMFKLLAPFEDVIEASVWALGIGEVFGSAAYREIFEKKFCTEGSVLEPICDGSFLRLFEGEYHNETMIPVILGHTPAGASIRQLTHYAQVIRFDAFRRYNYKVITNISVYGRSTPPAYDLSKITVPTYLYYGMGDTAINSKDILQLANALPNVVNVKKMSRESFNHFDFIWGIDAAELLYDDIVMSMIFDDIKGS